jgi:hypothetical protein
VPKSTKRYNSGRDRRNVLADEEDIDSTEVEIVKVGHSRHAFSASMHTGVELYILAFVLQRWRW